jgi:hypothetical protein
MNPLVLRIILALAPSIERLIIALIEHWAKQHDKKPTLSSEKVVLIDDAKSIFEDLEKEKQKKV